jgi:hypothetical protein
MWVLVPLVARLSLSLVTLPFVSLSSIQIDRVGRGLKLLLLLVRYFIVPTFDVLILLVLLLVIRFLVMILLVTNVAKLLQDSSSISL